MLDTEITVCWTHGRMCPWEYCPSVSLLCQGKGSICLWHPHFTQKSQRMWDLTACMPWKLKGRMQGKTCQTTCLSSLYSLKRNYQYICSLSWSSFSVLLSAAAVPAVQFLCNYGAALQEKHLLMCMSYLLAIFFISPLSILDYFALLELLHFCVSNTVRKEKKDLSLWGLPPPLHYMCRSSRCQTGWKTVKNLGA